MPPPQLDASALWPPGHPRSSVPIDDDNDEYYYDANEIEAEEGAPPQAVARSSHGRSYTKDDNSDNDDKDYDEGSETSDLFAAEPEPVTLPESTHTLFFTQPICSLPHLYGMSIVVVSIMCLVMALINNVDPAEIDWKDNPLSVPVNVSREVRIAQYLSIVIVLLMVSC